MAATAEIEPPREKAHASLRLRACNISARTAHIAAMGALFGGHVFSIAEERLLPWLYASLITGAALAVVEIIPERGWWSQGSGVMSMAKVLLLLSMPWLWDYRVPLLAGVILLGSVGSHMPHRFRHFPLFGGRKNS
jgi:hypothetical protein